MARPTLNDHLAHPARQAVDDARLAFQREAAKGGAWDVAYALTPPASGIATSSLLIFTLGSPLWIVLPAAVAVIALVSVLIGVPKGRWEKQLRANEDAVRAAEEARQVAVRASIAADILTTYGVRLDTEPVPTSSRVQVGGSGMKDGLRVQFQMVAPESDGPVLVENLTALIPWEDLVTDQTPKPGLLRRLLG